MDANEMLNDVFANSPEYRIASTICQGCKATIEVAIRAKTDAEVQAKLAKDRMVVRCKRCGANVDLHSPEAA